MWAYYAWLIYEITLTFHRIKLNHPHKSKLHDLQFTDQASQRSIKLLQFKCSNCCCDVKQTSNRIETLEQGVKYVQSYQ